jgi:hypothetical protein
MTTLDRVREYRRRKAQGAIAAKGIEASVGSVEHLIEGQYLHPDDQDDPWKVGAAINRLLRDLAGEE